MVSYDQVILAILIFSLLSTVALLGYVAFGTTPRNRSRKH